MAKYHVREGPCPTAYAWTPLQNTGSEVRGAITVPNDANSIVEIWGAYCELTQTDATGAVVGVRLRGGGMKYGSYETILGGYANGTKTGNNCMVSYLKARVLKTKLAVNPGGEIWVDGNQISASDCGSTEVAVGLVFSNAAGEKRYGEVRFGSAGTLASAGVGKAALSLDPAGTTIAQIKVPNDAKHITNITVGVGGIILATAAGGTCFARVEGALPEGDIVVAGPGLGTFDTTTGQSGAHFESEAVETDVTVSPGGTLTCSGCQNGVDWGTPYIAIAIEMGV